MKDIKTSEFINYMIDYSIYYHIAQTKLYFSEHKELAKTKFATTMDPTELMDLPDEILVNILKEHFMIWFLMLC